jgi:sterol-4alpha-carboxylate 3-dehydrogenase (decarboxylating)
VSTRDFCIAVWKEFGHVPPFQIKIPKGLAWWMGWSAEWLAWVTGKEGNMSRGLILDATAVRYFDIAKAKRILGYVPRVGMAEAVRISCQVSSPLEMQRKGELIKAQHYKQQLDGQLYDREETLR